MRTESVPQPQPLPQQPQGPAPPQVWNIRELASMVRGGQLEWARQPGVTITGVQRTPLGYVFTYTRALQRSEWSVADVARDVALGMLPSDVSAKYGLTLHPFDVRELALWAKTIPKEPQSQAPFVDWEQPSRMGVPLAIWQAPGGYREPKPEPTIPERVSTIVSRGNPFQRATRIEVKLNDPEYWLGNPITGKYGINPQGKEQGVTYAWTPEDIYNITTTALLIYGAAVALKNLPRRLAIEKSIASREAVRRELYSQADQTDSFVAWREDLAQADREFWQNMQGPLETDPRLTQWHVETSPSGWSMERPGEWFLRGRGQPTGGLAATQRVIPEEFERVIWEAPYDLTQINMTPKMLPIIPSALPFMVPALIGLPRLKQPSSTITLPATEPTMIQIPNMAPTPKLKQPTMPRQVNIPFIETDVSTIVTPFIGLEPATEQTPKEALMPIQTPVQIQRSIQQMFEPPSTSTTTFTPRLPTDDFLRRRYKRKGKDVFGLYDWSRSFYPIKTAKEFLRGLRK